MIDTSAKGPVFTTMQRKGCANSNEETFVIPVLVFISPEQEEQSCRYRDGLL